MIKSTKSDDIKQDGLIRIVKQYKNDTIINVFVDYLLHPKYIPIDDFIFIYGALCEANIIEPDPDRRSLFTLRVNDAYIHNPKSPRTTSYYIDNNCTRKLIIRPHCFNCLDEKSRDNKTRYFDDNIYTRFVGYNDTVMGTIRANDSFSQLVAKHFKNYSNAIPVSQLTSSK